MRCRLIDEFGSISNFSDVVKKKIKKQPPVPRLTKPFEKDAFQVEDVYLKVLQPTTGDQGLHVDPPQPGSLSSIPALEAY
jgi:hypothetical protein